jgi:alkylation response protein AidB-like acyl-CoA dehydrogenase
MLSYRPPLRDMQFVLDELLDAPRVLRGLPAFEAIDSELFRQVTEEAGRFAAEVLAPLNASGDREGCRYEDGAVRTPAGFAQAYRQFREAGWPALARAPEDGGQGLPHLLDCALYEMLVGANHGWTMYPGLLHGAYACLKANGDEKLKAVYLPRIASGEWLATMCLTEPQAGSDLGLLRTRAAPAADGSYRIAGNKIFISGGEQDLTDNIVHLVLARLPDAPAGSKGISLFLVPKLIPNDNGTPGERNRAHCTGIEHKMGIHGSATCAMAFDDAVGWLIGEPNKGLNAMFVMMNAARLHVAAQGVGIAETAWQNSLQYARERLQSRAVTRPAGAGAAADPIAMHPPVRRLLLTQRAWLEGGRMLLYWCGLLLDIAEHHPDAQARREADERLALMTPVAKALLTEQGFHGASDALQVYGGYGFVRDTGIEQILRDARITMIYEGTNQIQAIDLLTRKILADGGARLHAWLDEVEAAADQAAGASSAYAGKVRVLAREIREAVAAIAQAAQRRPELPHWIAGEMLRLVGLCALGWLWLKAEGLARERLERDAVWYGEKRETAAYYFGFVLPEADSLLATIRNCIGPG